MPQYAAGRMVEPPVCVVSAIGTWKSATAAAEPDDDPPGVHAGSCGLRVGPGSVKAYSVVTVLPTTIAPAASSRCTTLAVTLAMRPASTGELHPVGHPATSITSFTPIGSPASGAPKGAASIRSAAARTRS